MFTQLEGGSGKVIGLQVSGKVTHQDYEQFTPKMEELIKQHGKIRVLFSMHQVQGFELHAMWDDMKFDYKHCNDIERCAVVGEKKWEERLIKLAKPFYRSEIKYFDAAQIDKAWAWLKEGT
jgi:hypothetical protein